MLLLTGKDVRYLTPILAQVEGESRTTQNYNDMDMSEIPKALLERNKST